MRVLMVCLGNICRSPLAEGILRAKVKEKNLGWTIDSAGTGGWHIGEAPHKLSQLIAKRHGVDITNLRGRKFTKEDMTQFDLIFVMDSDNYRDLKYIAGEQWKETKVDLILNKVEPNTNQNVPDPWFDNTPEAFEHVYNLLEKACDKIIATYAD